LSSLAGLVTLLVCWTGLLSALLAIFSHIVCHEIVLPLGARLGALLV
jgi:hypothetical protein